MEPDAQSVVAAAAAGDRSAWEKIVARYAGLVWAVARGLRLSAADAADVSQATWLRLVENLRDVRDPEALGSWLATTARREGLAMIRKHREVPMPDGAESDLVDEKQQPPGQALLSDERDRELWAAFHRLPQRCQALLLILVVEPAASYAAAAVALEMPIGSLGPTRARCLSDLRRQLRAYAGEDGVVE